MNISRSGVLFLSCIDLPPETIIVMKIMLPFELLDKSATIVCCWGQVVRKDAVLTEKCDCPVLAAAILRYRFSDD